MSAEALRPEKLEEDVSKQLAALFEGGHLDGVAKLIARALKKTRPDISLSVFLEFSLKTQEYGSPPSQPGRRRLLGHLVVRARGDAAAQEPVVDVGLSPSFTDDTKLCRGCDGTGVERGIAKTPDQLPPRPFSFQWRELKGE